MIFFFRYRIEFLTLCFFFLCCIFLLFPPLFAFPADLFYDFSSTVLKRRKNNKKQKSKIVIRVFILEFLQFGNSPVKIHVRFSPRLPQHYYFFSFPPPYPLYSFTRLFSRTEFERFNTWSNSQTNVNCDVIIEYQTTI